MKVQRASVDQVIKVHSLLAKSVKQLDNGQCEYVDGSDKTIADAVGCSPHTVAHVRREMFGHLYEGGYTCQITAGDYRGSQIACGKIGKPNINLIF